MILLNVSPLSSVPYLSAIAVTRQTEKYFAFSNSLSLTFDPIGLRKLPPGPAFLFSSF